jgi:mRNA-degrading endonuclease RelE of RelBE toxin-antitoxin system
MKYKVHLADDAEKFLSKLSTSEEERIRKRIEKLETENPYHYLERKGDTWVLKVGRSGYRVAVDMDDKQKKAKISYIQKRSKFYQEYEVNK